MSGTSLQQKKTEEKLIDFDEPDTQEESLLSNAPCVGNFGPPKRTASLSGPSPKSKFVHNRSFSYAPENNNINNRKRLTLSFPIQTSSPFPRGPFSACAVQSPITPFTPASEAEPSNDPVKFLTVLASQERRVLELREELSKADAELEELKRKWALHEAIRKTSSVRAEQMRPVEASDQLAAALKHGRNRSVESSISGGSGNEKRMRTFSNSKHHRTLSLLSPERNNFVMSPSTPQPSSALDDDARSEHSMHSTSAMSQFETSQIYGPSGRKKATGTHQEALIATGKQMAEDFKEGLWTFIEDLRQATVGEEGAQTQKQGQSGAATPLKAAGGAKYSATGKAKAAGSGASTPKPKFGKTTSNKSKPKAKKLIDIGDDFWNEHDPMGPLSSPKSETAEKRESLIDDDIPAAESRRNSHIRPESLRWSTSTAYTDLASGALSPVDTTVSTPRTSISFSRPVSPDGKRSLQFDDRQKTTAELLKSLADAHEQQQSGSWNAVVNHLNVSNLKRTATAFLSQVEKSLAPLPLPSEISSIPTLTPAKPKKQH